MGYITLSTPLGTLGISGDTAIESIHFRCPSLPEEPNALLLEAASQLCGYFQKRLTQFDLPLHPKGTPFQQEVWQALIQIPYGTTTTYGKIAQSIGRPTAYRGVGQANHRNPIPIVIPCHRVVGNAGLLGYAGGLDMKQALLTLESLPRISKNPAQ